MQLEDIESYHSTPIFF